MTLKYTSTPAMASELTLTPEMAEHARWHDAGEGALFASLLARRAARQAGRVIVSSYVRSK